MGFRSTLTVEETYLPLPAWFIEKYKDDYHFSTNQSGVVQLPMHTMWERKFYSDFVDTDIFLDIQKVMKDSGDHVTDSVTAILLHECDGITRVEITKDRIQGAEPTEWKRVDCVTHNYCYGCSDIENLPAPNQEVDTH